MMKGCTAMANTSGYLRDCASISSNWSMIISANWRPVWRRLTSAGRSLSSAGERTSRLGPGTAPHTASWVAGVPQGREAGALGGGGPRRGDAEARTKGEEFDVVAESDGEPSSFGPFVLRPLVDRDVVVAAVGGQFHWRGSEPEQLPLTLPL